MYYKTIKKKEIISKKGRRKTWKRKRLSQKAASVGQKLKESSQLYLLMLPSIIIFLIFTYYPMYGVIIAFKDFKPALGIMGSKWVGMKNFITFFKSYQFSVTIKNTIVISLYTIAVTFPLPIIMALMVNQIRSTKFKNHRKAGWTAWIQTSKPYGFCICVPSYLCMDRSLAACRLGFHPLHCNTFLSWPKPLWGSHNGWCKQVA